MADEQIVTKKASLLDFFQTTVLELRKVDWPSREKTIRLTLIVIGVSLIIGIFIGGLDILLTQAVQKLLELKK